MWNFSLTCKDITIEYKQYFSIQMNNKIHAEINAINRFFIAKKKFTFLLTVTYIYSNYIH